MPLSDELWWAGFALLILGMLALDLFVFHRKQHEIQLKEALIWSGVWVGLALTFNAGLYLWQGKGPALEFLTGYLIEKSLSVDNIFVFVLIFTYFRIPAKYQHDILFWGIIGALVMRAVFIGGGIALLNNVHWIIYVFGVLLVLTGIKMALSRNKEVHPDKNLMILLLKKIMPVTNEHHGGRFFVRKEGRLWATSLFVALLAVETTDLIFAVDSIPAILAITQDPFIVYTSNVFAILGLRSLYFALANLVHLFHYLHYGLAAVLIFVGAKMLMAGLYKIPIGVSLGVIAGLIGLSVLISILRPRPAQEMDTTQGGQHA